MMRGFAAFPNSLPTTLESREFAAAFPTHEPLTTRHSMPRTLAIGDIHGCLTALKTVVDAAQIEPEDLLITLGDYVDRGPDSRGVLDWLIEKHRGGRLVAIRGNHDLMMSQARFDREVRDVWISVGGVQALKSYGENGMIGSLDDVPSEHWSFIDRTCCRYFETERHIFVHAMLEPQIPLIHQKDSIIYWERFRDPQPHCSGKIMVCGHTTQKLGHPANLGHALCLDTWAHGAGWLTCFDVDSGEYWQARETGEVRSVNLP